MKYSSDKEAFDSYCRDWFDCETEAQLAWLVWQASAVTTRAELASQVQPVAWGMPDANGNIVDAITDLDKCEGMKKWGEQYSVPLYLHPPTPAWHDAPTCAGLWVRMDAEGNDQSYQVDDAEKWASEVEHGERFYGPIPQDKEGGAA